MICRCASGLRVWELKVLEACLGAQHFAHWFHNGALLDCSGGAGRQQRRVQEITAQDMQISSESKSLWRLLTRERCVTVMVHHEQCMATF